MQVVSLQLSEAATSAVVSQAHFGLNMEFGYEAIGGQPWERFDEVFEKTQSTVIRYPGGTETELYFDINNPNSTTIATAGGGTRTATPQQVVLDYAADTGSSVSIVLPSARFLTESAYGTRRFDEQYADDLLSYIQKTLADAGPGVVSSFEIGNEYEAYMTSEEYGALASRMSEIIDQGIAEAGIGNPPGIFVQAWGLSIHGTHSVSDLEDRNQIVIDQFTAEQLSLIDGVASHYYFLPDRHSGEIYEHRADNLAASTEPFARLHDAWSAAAGREITSYVSEWNISHHASEYTGLKQTSVLLEAFSAFIRNGVDALSFWSSQYHATSFADRHGDLQSAGTAFGYLASQISDKTVLDDTIVGGDVSATAFWGDGQLVVSISSTSAKVQDLSLNTVFAGYDLSFVSASQLTVVPGSFDGWFKQSFGFPAYADPDAQFAITALETSLQNGSLTFSLDAYETAFITFETDRQEAEVTTIDGLIIPETYQFLSFRDRDRSIEIDMDVLSGGADNPRALARPVEIALEATAFDDVIWGSRQGDIIFGGDGADLLNGRFGIDRLNGQGGDDTILGGHDSDVIDGGAGFDVLGYWTSEQGVSVDMVRGQAIATGSGTDTFQNIEGLILTEHADSVQDSAAANNRYLLEGGDDTIRWAGGVDTIDGGGGTDRLVISDPAQTVLTLSASDTAVISIGSAGVVNITQIELLEVGGREYLLSDFDSAGLITGPELQELVKLYVAYFNRAADNIGVLFWADKIAEGMHFDTVIEHFSSSTEYQRAFQSGDRNADFVEQVYTNVLGRISDADGLSFWIDVLDTGAASRGEFVQTFLDGVNNSDNLDDRALVSAKTELGLRSALVDQSNDVGRLQEMMARLAEEMLGHDQSALFTSDPAVLDQATDFGIDVLGLIDVNEML